jgi:Zn-dependent M28 family amino/carboxypeptidase
MSTSLRSCVLLGLAGVWACGPMLVPEGADASADASGSTADGGAAEGPESGPLECGTHSPEAIGACVERARYLDDLQFVADIRVPGDTHWQAVQDLCFDRLTQLGYAVEIQDYGPGVNIVGRRHGLVRADEEVVIAAHYDHIPGCAGADDNASGVAGVLEAARVLAPASFERTLVVACWDQEEVGLIGSSVFAKAAFDRSVPVVVNFNFEMIGFTSDEPRSQSVPAGFDLLFPDAYRQVEANGFRGDFVALVADEGARVAVTALDRHAERIGLPAVVLELEAQLVNSPLVGDLRRSDHAAFWNFGFPAIMLTDTSNFRYANYHCAGGEDSVDLLDHDFAASIVEATVAAAAESLVLQP